MSSMYWPPAAPTSKWTIKVTNTGAHKKRRQVHATWHWKL